MLQEKIAGVNNDLPYCIRFGSPFKNLSELTVDTSITLDRLSHINALADRRIFNDC
jgi:hypothetical protein